MKLLLIFGILIPLLTVNVSAEQLAPPEAPAHVSDVMPREPESFSEGLWQLILAVSEKAAPEATEAARGCLSVVAAVVLSSTLQPISGQGKKLTELFATLTIALILLGPTRSLIRLGIQTVQELTQYGKLLLPVMTAGLAAQGGVSKSAALYAGTALFNTALSTLIASLLTPMIYIFLALSTANSAVGEGALKKLCDLVKWGAGWVLKSGLYLFTGYMSLTGVISGTADAAALKMTKATISSLVPVIGGILSDASESVLVSAGMVKNAAGIYGMLALLALCLEPFVTIGIRYLLLKLTAAICAVFSGERASGLISDFSSAMGILLAATGTICLMLLISTVCFMKGVG